MFEVKGKTGEGGSSVNEGNIVVEPGGTISAESGTYVVTGDGWHVIKAGGKAKYGDGYLVGTSADTTAMVLTSGTFSYSYSDYLLEGNAAIKFSLNFAPQTADDLTLTVAEGATLTIDGEVSGNYQKITGSKAGHTVVVEGTIAFGNDGNSNFYDGSNQLKSSITEGTFKWTTNKWLLQP
jgi:hypothetical protein